MISETVAVEFLPPLNYPLLDKRILLDSSDSFNVRSFIFLQSTGFFLNPYTYQKCMRMYLAFSPLYMLAHSGSRHVALRYILNQHYR